jgi:hypothetical protein
MDLRWGAISSPSNEDTDFDLVCLAGLSSLAARFSSHSESEDTAVEVEATDGDRFSFF